MLRKVCVGGGGWVVQQQNRVTPSPFGLWTLTWTWTWTWIVTILGEPPQKENPLYLTDLSVIYQLQLLSQDYDYNRFWRTSPENM